MGMLGLDELEQLVRANGVWWYGLALRRGEDHILREVLEFRVNEP